MNRNVPFYLFPRMVARAGFGAIFMIKTNFGVSPRSKVGYTLWLLLDGFH